MMRAGVDLIAGRERSLWRIVWLWAPVVAYLAVIFHLSSQSNPLPELTEHVWDKLLHTTEYSGLAFLFARAFRGAGAGWLPAVLLAILATSLYGASDEWHQAFVPLRTSDIHDWIADTIGGTIGAACYTAVALLL
jgi:VanZ family protein